MTETKTAQTRSTVPVVPLPTDEALAEHVRHVHEWFTYGCGPKALTDLHDRDHAHFAGGVFAGHRHDGA